MKKWLRSIGYANREAVGRVYEFGSGFVYCTTINPADVDRKKKRWRLSGEEEKTFFQKRAGNPIK